MSDRTRDRIGGVRPLFTGGMRLRGLIRKEFKQIVRDPSSLAIAFALPVVLLFIFGYGVSLDAEHIPIAIVVDEPSADTASFTAALYRSIYFDPIVVPDMIAADRAMRERRVSAIVRLRSDFGRRRRFGIAPIQIVVNGVDANTARLSTGYLDGVWLKWRVAKARDEGGNPSVPVLISDRVWFNSELESRDFLVPGLIAIIMTLIGALLTAMVMAREWERGTMEALLATPVKVGEILLGKLIPYFLLGTGGMALSVTTAIWLFHVPFRGSVIALFVVSTLFLLTALGMGLLISVVTKNQFVAGQTAIIVSYLPAYILSGFIFDIRGMPAVIQFLTHFIPARYFVAILQTEFLAGDVRSILIPNGAALFATATIFLGLSRIKSRKSLE